MEKKQIHQDVYVGIAGLIFCGLVWALNMDLPSAAAMMPRLLAGILAALSVIILTQGILKSKLPASEQGEKAFTIDSVKIPLIAWGLIAVYVLLFKYVGYFVSTGVMLIGFMRFMKIKNWKPIIAITVVYLIIVYVVFVRLLGVNIAGFGVLGRLF